MVPARPAVERHRDPVPAGGTIPRTADLLFADKRQLESELETTAKGYPDRVEPFAPHESRYPGGMRREPRVNHQQPATNP